jgi:hypothetical protein
LHSFPPLPGIPVFERRNVPSVEEKQKRLEFLEKKVQTKDEVLGELMAEHTRAKKKSWGSFDRWIL